MINSRSRSIAILSAIKANSLRNTRDYVSRMDCREQRSYQNNSNIGVIITYRRKERGHKVESPKQSKLLCSPGRAASPNIDLSKLLVQL